jgi:hypothetical protein
MHCRVAFALLALYSCAAAAPPPGYYDRVAGLSGGPMKAALHEIIRGHVVIPYSQLHAPLARLHEDPANPNNVVGPPGVNNANVSRGVLIRAVGPGLADFGVNRTLQYPRLKVVFSNGTIAAENTGWQSAANRDALIAATTRAGAFPLSATRADSALLVSLLPVPYTIQVSGADGGTGVALVEVYEVP